MIAPRSGATQLPRVTWRLSAKRAMRTLTDFLAANAFGDPRARRRQIEDAVKSLRYSPLRCPVAGVKDGLTLRRLTVGNRYYVYYAYIPPRGMSSGGTLSIRSVKHVASENPFLDVREALASDQPLGALSTRDRVEPVAIA